MDSGDWAMDTDSSSDSGSSQWRSSSSNSSSRSDSISSCPSPTTPTPSSEGAGLLSEKNGSSASSGSNMLYATLEGFKQQEDEQPVVGDSVSSADRPEGGKRKRFWLPIFIVFLTNTLDWCLISALNPAAPGYLGLDNTDKGAATRVGAVIGANAAVQLVTNIFVGRFVDRFGSMVPFMLGLVIMLFSTLVLAFAADISFTHRYWLVLGSRIVQGFSSGLASTAGMAWLMSLFTESMERSRAIGIAVTGVGLGVIVGMPLGSAFSAMGVIKGWRTVFLLLDSVLVLNIALLLYMLKSNITIENKAQEDPGWRVLIRLATDPYVFHIFLLSFLLNLGMSAMESSLPMWVSSVLNAPNWSLGVLFLSCHIPYAVLAPLCSQLFCRIGRHWALILGNILLGLGMFIMPMLLYISRRYQLSPIFACIGLLLAGSGLGLFDAASMPLVADIVEKRHANLLGSAVAVINSAWAFGFFVGPVVVNTLVDQFGYQWVYIFVGQLILLSGFSGITLGSVRGKNGKKLSDADEPKEEPKEDPKMLSVWYDPKEKLAWDL